MNQIKTIKDILENSFLSENNLFPHLDLSPFVGTASEIEFGAAIRLLKSWCLYLKNNEYKIDFEICLRDYLLIIKDTVRMNKNYVLSEFAQKNLFLFKIGDSIGAKTVFPSSIKTSFVKDCYSGKKQIRVNNQCSLKTNQIVKKITGFNYFKSPEQKTAVHAALDTPAGFTALISMPTGGGKSLVTQTVSYQNDGLTIVVVPTISLMLDQAKNAREIIKVAKDGEIEFYHSNCDCSKIASNIDKKKIKLLFISPEAIMRNERIKSSILGSNKTHYLKNIIFDEAHIIVEWGASFRIDFQCLDAFRKSLMRDNHCLRTFLLSATFSSSTVEVLKNIFSEDDKWIEVRCDALRKEQRYCFTKLSSFAEKQAKTFELILSLPHPMIIYVRSPNDANKLVSSLKTKGINNVKSFTGKTSDEERKKLIDSWSNNEFEIMVATCAFGVGVDKKDVRTVLHLYVPNNPNSYYQEAGRGGRDGYPCLSVILYTDDDIQRAFNYTQKTITTEKFFSRWFAMIKKSGDSKVAVDTSIRPDYREKEDFDYLNDKDIMWNAYVILLLKRRGYIRIDEIEYRDNRYYFNVTVLKRDLLFESSAKSIMEKIRNEEWGMAQREFLLMKTLLYNSNTKCVSEVFCTTYELADQCCSGCNAHDDIIDLDENGFGLKKAICINQSQCIVASPFRKKEITIILYDDINYVLKILNNKVSSFVGEPPFDYFPASSLIDLFSIHELMVMFDLYPMIFGDSVCIEIDKGSEYVENILEIGRRMLAKDIAVVYLLKDDICLKSGKTITEVVQGTTIREYQLEDFVNNV